MSPTVRHGAKPLSDSPTFTSLCWREEPACRAYKTQSDTVSGAKFRSGLEGRGGPQDPLTGLLYSQQEGNTHLKLWHLEARPWVHVWDMFRILEPVLPLGFLFRTVFGPQPPGLWARPVSMPCPFSSSTTGEVFRRRWMRPGRPPCRRDGASQMLEPIAFSTDGIGCLGKKAKHLAKGKQAAG